MYFLKCYSLSEVNLQILPETTAIVVPRRFGIPEALQERRRLQDLLGDEIVRRAIDGREILHHQLRRLRLSRAGLAGNDDHLIGTGVIGCSHLTVRGGAHGE